MAIEMSRLQKVDYQVVIQPDMWKITAEHLDVTLYYTISMHENKVPNFRLS